MLKDLIRRGYVFAPDKGGGGALSADDFDTPEEYETYLAEEVADGDSGEDEDEEGEGAGEGAEGEDDHTPLDPKAVAAENARLKAELAEAKKASQPPAQQRQEEQRQVAEDEDPDGEWYQAIALEPDPVRQEKLRSQLYSRINARQLAGYEQNQNARGGELEALYDEVGASDDELRAFVRKQVGTLPASQIAKVRANAGQKELLALAVESLVNKRGGLGKRTPAAETTRQAGGAVTPALISEIDKLSKGMGISKADARKIVLGTRGGK